MVRMNLPRTGNPYNQDNEPRTLAYHFDGRLAKRRRPLRDGQRVLGALEFVVQEGARAGGTVWWTPPERARTTSASRTGGR